MSRPKPTILLQYPYTDFSCDQVLDADGVYAVCFNRKPVSLRNVGNTMMDQPALKYGKTIFPSPGHALNLASKLNTLFKTDAFEVYRFNIGEKVVKKK